MGKRPAETQITKADLHKESEEEEVSPLTPLIAIGRVKMTPKITKCKLQSRSPKESKNFILSNPTLGSSRSKGAFNLTLPNLLRKAKKGNSH